jgi:uncharacterized protein (DUF427 family)
MPTPKSYYNRHRKISVFFNLSEFQGLQPCKCQNIKCKVYSQNHYAESDKTVVVENNHYFPKDAINQEYFKESNTHTTCPWKGVASYYSIEVDGQVNKDAAWYYPTAKDRAKNIEGYIAFWKGVKVEA